MRVPPAAQQTVLRFRWQAQRRQSARPLAPMAAAATPPGLKREPAKGAPRPSPRWAGALAGESRRVGGALPEPSRRYQALSGRELSAARAAALRRSPRRAAAALAAEPRRVGWGLSESAWRWQPQAGRALSESQAESLLPSPQWSVGLAVGAQTRPQPALLPARPQAAQCLSAARQNPLGARSSSVEL